jgi:FkbM family methyltransferase
MDGLLILSKGESNFCELSGGITHELEMKVLFEKLARKVVPRPVRNLLRRPGASARQFSAEIAFSFGMVGRATLMQGLTVRCHPVCRQSLQAYSQDQALIDELTQFEKTIVPGAKLLDVGCHWGAFSMVALHRGGSTSEVLAVDASKSAVKMAGINLALNGFSGRSSIINAAAGSEDGRLEMLTTGPGGLGFYVVAPEPRPDTVSIRQISLTKLCADRGFLPTHLKIDVEGFEEETLLGARELLLKARPFLFLELHGDLIRRRHHDPALVLRLLCDAGYSRWELAGVTVDEESLAQKSFNVRIICLPK